MGILRQQGRMHDQDGQAERCDQRTMEVLRGTAEWEYGRYVGAAAQRTTISTARGPDRLGQAQDSAIWKCYDQSKVQLRHLNQIVSDDGSGCGHVLTFTKALGSFGQAP